MVIINYTSGNEFFTINGSKYPRIYQAVENGTDSIAIYNIHDIKNKLLGTTHFSDFSINGSNYNSQDEIIDVLLPILYEKGSTSSGDTDLSAVYDAIDAKEDEFSKNSAFNKNFGKTSGTVAEGNDARFSKAETAYGWGNHADYGYLTALNWGEVLNTPTTLSGYGITDVYTQSAIADIFAGNTPISGYNKTNWDAAFSWGDHALVGYLTEIQVVDTNINPLKHEIAEVEGTILNESVTQLNTPTLNGNTLTISFQNENNVAQTVSIDLSSLNLTETGITNATYDAAQNVITLEEQDGDVWTINLSEFSIISNTDAQGVTTLTQEGTIKLTVSKVGQTGEYSDLLNIPTTLAGFGLQSEADGRYVNVGEDIDWVNIINTPTNLAGYGITDAYTQNQIDNKDTQTYDNAISWVQSQNFLTSFTETDPTVPQHVKDITQNDIDTWNSPTVDQDNKVRVIQISEDDLPTNFTDQDVVNYLNSIGITISDKEIISVEVTDGTIIVEVLEVNITSPSEGETITGDVNLTFDIINTSGINIITPQEGEDITGDINVTFELI